MPKATDIIDYLPTRVGELPRRDLEQRLKRLRAARLYPPARAVGDRKAEPVNDRYMANLFLALVGSVDAKHCAEAVQRLYDLPRRVNEPIHGRKAAAFLRKAGGSQETLGNLILSEIRSARRGKPPVVTEVHVVDGEAEALVALRTEEPSREWGEMVWFGSDTQSEVKRQITVHLSGGVIKELADFLGPLEGAA